uniref:Anaphase-promoting complex subunit 4 n=1 Tax=Zeugodacus cucurbitae TaxID=28588 RepID=A0A0A1X529_ZEUCU
MSSKPIILPISTRSVGLNIRCLVKEIQLLLGNKYKDFEYYRLTNALYRVTLLRLHMKINKGFRNCIIDLRKSDAPYFITEDFERSIECMGPDFTIIHQLLSAVGYVQYGRDSFVPVLPLLKQDQHCDPINVRFTNLRNIVTSLADRETSIEVRRHFWEYNPIPGAKWSTTDVDGKDEFATNTYLSNPNDIMPENYNLPELNEDISIIQVIVTIISREYPKYITNKRIDFCSSGSEAQFVSSIAKPIRCSSYLDNHLETPKGDYDEFWSPRWLTQTQRDLGVNCLFGEYSEAIENQCLLYIRSEEVATQYIAQHYWAMFYKVFK